MDYYLQSLILEAIERLKTLKAKFPNKLNVHFHQLAQTTQIDIDDNIALLDDYLKDAQLNTPSNFPQLLTKIKEVHRDVKILENVVVAAINRYNNEDDVRVNKVVKIICDEINYPLIPPTVSCLSQKYYRIFTGYNLLCVPLLECEFLLHLPDLYHELGHPLIDIDNNPKTQEFNISIGRFLSMAKKHFNKMIDYDIRNNNGKLKDYYQLWKRCWGKWLVEFYCDIYAVCTLGPAYCWSHLHISAKQGGNPFEVPRYHKTTHPNDHARMLVITTVLYLMGFSKEKEMILVKWGALNKITTYQKGSTFKLAYPEELLQQCAIFGLQATKSIGGTIATSDHSGVIFQTLNEAWTKFWDNSITYFKWEKEAIQRMSSNKFR